MEPGQMRVLRASDVLHIPLFSFDGLKGISPIHLARQGVGLARAAEKFGARFFGNGAKPGGVLSTNSDLDDIALKAAKESWERGLTVPPDAPVSAVGDRGYLPCATAHDRRHV
jgi:phage portal protein BeeE